MLDALDTRTHCPYCAFQCGIHVRREQGGWVVEGDESFPVNRGRLCVKGFTAASLLTHPERLTQPLVRRDDVLQPASWDDALDLVASRLLALKSKHGPDALGVFGSGALTNEKAYLLGKFARVALGTSAIDYNGRFCMSSAAAASLRAFGIDRGLPFPVEDIAGADVVLFAGANPLDTLPPISQYLEAQRARGGTLIAVDPRRSATALFADLHLKLAPGTDAALANGLLHLLVRERSIDEGYIRARTEGFDQVRAAIAGYWPERVERLTGVPEEALLRAARTLAAARSVVVLTGRGPEQQSQGVDNALSFINLALALGAPGKPHSGWGCLTGQGNGQGGREHGQKADQLPGYRSISDPAARRAVASVWGVSEESLPAAGRSAYELLKSLGSEVHALLVVGSNPAVSAPNAGFVRSRLRALSLLVVCDFFLSETALLADVVLPSAQWAEEDGTVTNLEGRVILRRRAMHPPAGARTDLEILCSLAERLGHGERFAFQTPAEVFDELARCSAGAPADYAGLSHRRLRECDGVFWPCPRPDHPGTPRLFADRFPTPSGRARFHAVHHRGPAELPDEHYPLFLTTGRLLTHYQSGTQTRRVPRLAATASEPTVQVHAAAARHAGVAAGDRAWIHTRRGRAQFRVELSSAVREDTLFVPFHWGGEQCVNDLTHDALDPISRMPEFKVCAARLEKAPPLQEEEP